LCHESLAHSEGVAATAGELALTYGVDVETARIAGLLHDWDRDLSSDELLDEARSWGGELSDIERSEPRLLHADTGARSIARAFPDASEELLHAVAAHTVGDVVMTPLDRVVYVADMLEPSRDFPGVVELRAAVGSVSLDELYLRCYQHTLRYLVAARRPLHPRTVGAWNALVGGGVR
jgi:predicted HD superfamily hydrolase involved in NAD metabolism